MKQPFGKWIKARRRTPGLGLWRCALHARIGGEALRLIETGKSNPAGCKLSTLYGLAGTLCREFLERSRWSWLFLDEATQERIEAGRGTPADLVYLSTKTALLSRLWDEHMPKSMQSLRSNYYRERTYGPEDQEMLEVYRKDLLYLAEVVKE